ncbi:sodium-dependent glucose transporter 1 [Megalops cyprinoides]|uniref:sodium-dependent glucose transporter 1 n=1 Tax=Megalops cyprinoides TaxID=118141 RepID=UPI001864FB80|nr:sodium-dependent glucose transporter 1 [Megalops cyprinoides]
MSASATGEPAVKKKQVRFARMEEDDDNDDQDEDTLFDKRKDARRGVKSAIKGARKLPNSGSERVAVRGGGSSCSGGCHRWLITLALCGSFLGLGMCISVLGPTFEDLAINVKKNISNISYIFVGRSMGYIGGSVLGGVLFDCMNHHLLLGFSMLLTAFGMCAIPFCKKALLLTVLMSCVGVTMGFLDTGGNVLILDTWGDQAGPHMQALHFCFAAGAFVSPIIAKLMFGTGQHPGRNASAEPAPPESDRVSKALGSVLPFARSKSSSLQSMWAYIVIGAFVLLVSLLFFILYSRGTPARERARTASGKPLVARHHNALILLLFFFFFWYVGAEVAYGSFIFTYAKDYAHMEQAQAAGLNSLFWGTFATARGLAIICAACMSPGSMILLSLVGCTLSSLLLTLFSRNRAALWSCTALYGVSMATTFPSGISWVEQYTTVTGRSAAVFVVGAALGEMVLPALVGFLLGRTREHPVLMYLCLGTATVTSILFPVMYKLATSPGGAGSGAGKKPRDRGRPETEDSEYRQALLDAGGNEDEEEEEEEEGEAAEGGDEADQWNDADFEVIEMEDAGLLNSPGKAFPLGAVTLAPAGALPATLTAAAVTSDPAAEPASLSSLSDPSVTLLGDSPRRKLLIALDREKRD